MTEERIRALELEVASLKGQVDMLAKMFEGRMSIGPTTTSGTVHDTSWIYKLSKKQHAVMQMVADGCNNAMIADRLRCSESTVKGHIRAAQAHIKRKTNLNVSDRATTSEMFKDALANLDVKDADDYHVHTNLHPDWHANWTEQDYEDNADLYTDTKAFALDDA